ncbi:MAG: zinc-dependent peptidase [Wenzhouxiangellaceae bacterium]|nr:zinc-dependent peptidase [Wenzhouxiangellaceae bacterium]
MLAWLRRRRVERRAAELTPAWTEFTACVETVPCLARLDRDERGRLRQLSAQILASKEFHGAGGLQPQWQHCLPVAIHAALPILNIGLDGYRDFHSFILYSNPFEADFEEVDEAGVVHRGRDLRVGEAWHRGPVVLSLADVAESGHGLGFHVVVHELAHQFDHRNGEADGYPPLPREIKHHQWVAAFTDGYRRLLEMLERRQQPFIDEYAAESPAEFFAVCCEFFFDLPVQLADTEPEIYRLLTLFFRQDPARAARSSGQKS